MTKMWIIAGVAASLLLLASNLPVQKVYSDGAVPLTITLASVSRSRIGAASCEVFSSEEDARHTLEYLLPPERKMWSIVEDPYTGQPLQVNVGTSELTHSSLLWSTSRYRQFRHLVVIVRYADGRREGRLCEVPHLRTSRSLRVDLP